MSKVDFNTIPATWMQLFAASRTVRPCGFDATPHLELLDPTTSSKAGAFLPVEVKLMWAHTYCQENGKKFRLDTSGSDRTVNLQYSTDGRPYMVSATGVCSIYIDQDEVANATVNRNVFIRYDERGYIFPDDQFQIDSLLQSVIGQAVSKALSYAGFGVIHRTELEPEPTQPDYTSGLPFVMPGAQTVNPVASPAQASVASLAPPIPNQGAGNPATQQSPQPGCDQTMIQAYQGLSGQNQPSVLDQAKAVVYPYNGQFNGKTLGEILASNRGIYQIYYYAFEWPRADAVSAKIREAANVIWESLREADRARVLKDKQK